MKTTAILMACAVMLSGCHTAKTVEKTDKHQAERIIISEKAINASERHVVVVDSPVVIVEYVDTPARRVEYRAARVSIAACDTLDVVERTAVAATDIADTHEKAEPRPYRLPLYIVTCSLLLMFIYFNRRR